MIRRILVLCMGNICRSPMAEAMIRRDIPSVEVSSAGIGALVGQPADPSAVKIMQSRGLDITAHRGRQLESWMLQSSDLVFVMEREQKRMVEHDYPFAVGKVFLLGRPNGVEIDDPYQRSFAAFATAAEIIENSVHDWAKRIGSLMGATC